MKNHSVPIARKTQHRPDVFEIVLTSRTLSRTAVPGQFLHVMVPGPFLLRRPLSIHRVDASGVHLLFRVRGKGTEYLSRLSKGQRLDVLGPCGRGFTQEAGHAFSSYILLAGGMGVAPLVFLAQRLKGIAKKRIALLGAKNKNDILCAPQLKKLGWHVLCATDDGSRGMKGSATALLADYLAKHARASRAKLFACGPQTMFDALCRTLQRYPHVEGQVSFEQFMGCGIGICYACVIKTKNGYKRACKDGPVFNIKDICTGKDERCVFCSEKGLTHTKADKRRTKEGGK
jgi:dihydroorotate dehydrogenase electron transfer subunit